MKSLADTAQVFKTKLQEINDLTALESLRVEFFGKKGEFATLMALLGGLPQEQKKDFGQQVNSLKQSLSMELDAAKTKLEQIALAKKLQEERIDITIPARQYSMGKVHPISGVISQLKQIFAQLGFQFTEGPDIETDWNNFSALNIPPIHPARQMHDTFYLDHEQMLLRTHTSTVQIRHMQQHKPPIKIISIGKVYRSDMDATHTPMFHQLEGLYIAEQVTMMDLKAYLETFLRMFFELDELPIRLRPNHFPFTEPSVEVDVLCDRSNREEIKLGTGSDWLEILGAGMVHENVLKNVGIDHTKYQGFAFGVGIERLAMLKYNISDLRMFFEGDVRWLEYYGL